MFWGGCTAFAYSKKVVIAPWGATGGVDAVLLGLGKHKAVIAKL